MEKAYMIIKIKKHLNLAQGAPRFELETYRSAVDCSTTELYTRKSYLSTIYVWITFPTLYSMRHSPVYNLCRWGKVVCRISWNLIPTNGTSFEKQIQTPKASGHVFRIGHWDNSAWTKGPVLQKRISEIIHFFLVEFFFDVYAPSGTWTLDLMLTRPTL